MPKTKNVVFLYPSNIVIINEVHTKEEKKMFKICVYCY